MVVFVVIVVVIIGVVWRVHARRRCALAGRCPALNQSSHRLLGWLVRFVLLIWPRQMLTKWAGKEEELFAQIADKFKSSPDAKYLKPKV